ncbi:MAG: hypothetical protein EXR82_01555 [Gammaproteobacteria bacterium]|nr:hypothetical protein [Gammaproteobacteria bacterium]
MLPLEACPANNLMAWMKLRGSLEGEDGCFWLTQPVQPRPVCGEDRVYSALVVKVLERPGEQRIALV